jgi:hypothetical protein
VKPTAQGFFFLPAALGNPVFNDLTDVLGQVDGTFQVELLYGFGAGAGVNGTFYELRDRSLAPVITEGSVNRVLLYGKLFWNRSLGESVFVEFNTKLGQGTWDWDCTTCAESLRQQAFHWGVNGVLFVRASDNLAFGLSLGYQGDEARFRPGVIGLDHFPGRTDMGAPYRFFTIGLGFSTGFAKSQEGLW